MNIIWEFNIADLDGSDYYFLVDSEEKTFKEIAKTYFSTGKPVGKNWQVPLILKENEKYYYDFFHIKDRIENDIFDMNEDEDENLLEDVVCVTQRVYDELQPILKDEVEFLPMKSDDGTYYVMNIINIIDCLDKESSKCNMTPNGLIVNYEELVFDTKKLEGQHIFRIPELPFLIFVTDALREAIEYYDEVPFTDDELVYDGVSSLLEQMT